VPLAQIDAGAMAALFREMETGILHSLAEVEKDAPTEIVRAVDVCYIGQGYTVTVGLEGLAPDQVTGAELWDRFARVYRAKYGYFYDDVPAEVVSLRANGRVTARQYVLRPSGSPGGSADDARKGERPAYAPARRAMIAHALYDRSRLRPGMSLAGPAIIEETESTTVVGQGGRVEVDAYGTLVISVGEESA
jgi:N-methylhydantoinase A